METFWIIVAVIGWIACMAICVASKVLESAQCELIKAFQENSESQKKIQDLQDARHATEVGANQALARENGMLRGVTGAMARELAKRGFTPPEDDGDWWKRGERPPGS